MGILKKYFSTFFLLSLLSSNIANGQESKGITVDASDYKIDLLTFCELNANYFSARPYGKGIVFGSNKNKDWGVIYYDNQTNENFSDLFYIEPKTDGYWQKPKSFSVAINSYLNEGAFCFNDSLTTIYYTTNNESGKKKILSSGTVVPLKIYKATLDKGRWGNVEPFIFNNDEYNVAHPALSHDNKKIFFASDMPGGFGGTDLYVCYWHQGQWGKPVNLGKYVNSVGDETFPYLTPNGILYFATNGRKDGLGMMDIYSTEFINSEWKNVRNLGAPINSPKDDYGFFLDEKKLNGYITSNRIDGLHDQLYKFQWFKSECKKNKEVEQCYTFFEKATFPRDKQPLAYEWDMGDGTKIRGLQAEHCFAFAGEYKVELNIIDTTSNQLFFTESTYEISVAPITTPYIEIKGDLMPTKTIDFNGTKSKIPKVKLTDLIWDFGDGHKAMGLKVKHAYANLGKYMITLYGQGKDSLQHDVEECVFKLISITEDGKQPIEINEDSIADFNEVAQKLYAAKDNDSITYKVQLKQSILPISVDPKNFNGIKNVEEYNENGIYGYTVGKSNELDALYPLYNEVKIKGFKSAQVVAFDNKDKLLNSPDSTRRKLLIGGANTRISGRIISRYGDPLAAKIIVENLITGLKVKEIIANEEDGKFMIELNNDNLYGFFAEKDSFYSVSNFIDLREEIRPLEIKKNIEMIPLTELYEDNVALRINNLFFGIKEYNLDIASYPELNRLSKIIKLRTNLTIEITGHTDNSGKEDYNLELSYKRANTVKEYLISAGCKASQIIVKGLGSSQPLVGNNTERGKYINRRVEMKFLMK